MKKIVLILLIVYSLTSFGQNEINRYKYIIVPKQFDAFKKQNQYQTSTLVKYLFSEKGFNVIYDDALPAELSSNRCLGLLLGLNDASGMFSTKVSLSLKDCNSKEVFRTEEGLSKVKVYKESYDEAIREAFNASLANFNYAYSEETIAAPITVSFKNDVKEMPVKNSTQVATQNAVEVAQPIQEASAKAGTPNVTSSAIAAESVVSENVVYAQDIPNGYQLVDSTPKIVMKIFKTSQEHMYIGEEISGNSGLVYTKNGLWFFEYYSGDTLMVKTLQIKF